jgi:hypothetical protein
VVPLRTRWDMSINWVFGWMGALDISRDICRARSDLDAGFLDAFAPKHTHRLACRSPQRSRES